MLIYKIMTGSRVEFMSSRTGKSPERTEELFCKIKDRYRFATEQYAGLTGDIARLYRIIYDTSTEAEAIKCYQVHALLHLYRFISYSYPKPKSSYLQEYSPH